MLDARNMINVFFSIQQMVQELVWVMVTNEALFMVHTLPNIFYLVNG